jgi:hypothetical protein
VINGIYEQGEVNDMLGFGADHLATWKNRHPEAPWPTNTIYGKPAWTSVDIARIRAWLAERGRFPIEHLAPARGRSRSPRADHPAGWPMGGRCLLG